MSSGQCAYTPTRARVRVTYGSQRSKPSAATQQAVSSRRHAAYHSTPELTSDISYAPSSDPPSEASPSSDEGGESEAVSRKENMAATPKRRMAQATLFGFASATSKRARGTMHRVPGIAMEGLFPEIANTNNRISTPAVLPRRSTHAHHKHRREVHKKEQTFLDFGQRLLEPKPCQQCGMTYQRGRKEDESLHTKFHRAWQRRQTKLLSWAAGTSKSDESAVAAVVYPQKLTQSSADSDAAAVSSMATIRFVSCQSSSKRELQRALDILNVANEHLGAVGLELADLEQRQRKIFLYISPKGQVEGCILAEAIESAWRVVAARGTAPGPAGPENNHTTVEHAREPCPAICGINRIWVVPHARRCGVASQMIQAVCKQFVYGCIIDSSSIAFTQPTSDGRALAQRVFKRSDFLVYAED